MEEGKKQIKGKLRITRMKYNLILKCNTLLPKLLQKYIN